MQLQLTTKEKFQVFGALREAALANPAVKIKIEGLTIIQTTPTGVIKVNKIVGPQLEGRLRRVYTEARTPVVPKRSKKKQNA